MEGKQQAMNLDSFPSVRALRTHILKVLHRSSQGRSIFPNQPIPGAVSSSVMLLLGRRATGRGEPPQTCIILNKRSRKVRQAGDLCCPGGTVEAELDPYLARLLSLPGSPLTCWPYWSHWLGQRPGEARLLSLLLSTGLRESWEEMRLWPCFVRFLGPLPSQRLLLFHRIIYPMVGWITWQRRFIPSWEVERIVTIPLAGLLTPEFYARYRLHVTPEMVEKYHRETQDFPCFIHEEEGRTEILWGATYKIVTSFVELVLGFTPPDMPALPMVPGILDEGYIFGRE